MKQTLLLSSSLAAFFIFTQPSIAEITEPRGMNHPLRQVLRDMDQVRSDAEEVLIRSRYCRPPHQPQKRSTQAELDALQTRLGQLRAQVAQQERTFNRAGNNEMGKALRGAFPRVAGVDPPDHGTERESVYWAEVKKLSVPAQEAIDAKRAALKRAREDDCGQTESSKADIVVQPPLPPPPPPPPTEPPKERVWDPLAGLTKPDLKAADIPVFPQFFCSEAEKQAMLARIEPAKTRAQSAADASEAYARAVEARKALLTGEGLPEHWQRSMDYEAKNARFERDSHLSTIKTLDLVRHQIELTPVVDCTTPPKEEPIDKLKTGWDFRGGIDYGTGKLVFPESGYLGVEDPVSTERLNGIFKAAGEHSGVRKAAAHLELPVGWTVPNIFQPLGGRLTETRLRAGISRTSADATLWGHFNPMGDRLFIPGLTNDIADTNVLQPTFNAIVRDNTVDEIFSRVGLRRSTLSFGLAEDFNFAGCEDFTLTKTFGLRQSWSDRRETFSAEVRDYFPVDFPGFDVRADYSTFLDSSTTALELGLDGTYAPKAWNGLYLKAGVDGWVGFTDTDGSASLQLDVNGASSEQAAEFSKSETTFGYGLRAGIGFDFGQAKIELGAEYRQDGGSPVPEFGPGVVPTINHGDDELFIGTLRTTFTF